MSRGKELDLRLCRKKGFGGQTDWFRFFFPPRTCYLTSGKFLSASEPPLPIL